MCGGGRGTYLPREEPDGLVRGGGGLNHKSVHVVIRDRHRSAHLALVPGRDPPLPPPRATPVLAGRERGCLLWDASPRRGHACPSPVQTGSSWKG